MNKPVKHGHLKADISSRLGCGTRSRQACFDWRKDNVTEEKEIKEVEGKNKQINYYSLEWQW